MILRLFNAYGPGEYYNNYRSVCCLFCYRALHKIAFDVYQNYVIRHERRDDLVAHLRNSGIEVLISWQKPVHQQKALGLDHFNLPVTERISAEVISLPMYPELTDEEVQYVIEAVKKYFI